MIFFFLSIPFKYTCVPAAPCFNSGVTDVCPPVVSTFVLRLVLSLCGFQITTENFAKN